MRPSRLQQRVCCARCRCFFGARLDEAKGKCSKISLSIAWRVCTPGEIAPRSVSVRCGRPEFGQALSVVLSLPAWVLNVYRALEILLLSLSPTSSPFPTSDARGANSARRLQPARKLRPRSPRLTSRSYFERACTLLHSPAPCWRPPPQPTRSTVANRPVRSPREPSLAPSARVDPFFLTAAYPAPLQKGPPPSA